MSRGPLPVPRNRPQTSGRPGRTRTPDLVRAGSRKPSATQVRERSLLAGHAGHAGSSSKKADGVLGSIAASRRSRMSTSIVMPSYAIATYRGLSASVSTLGRRRTQRLDGRPQDRVARPVVTS